MDKRAPGQGKNSSIAKNATRAWTNLYNYQIFEITVLNTIYARHIYLAFELLNLWYTLDSFIELN